MDVDAILHRLSALEARIRQLPSRHAHQYQRQVYDQRITHELDIAPGATVQFEDSWDSDPEDENDDDRPFGMGMGGDEEHEDGTTWWLLYDDDYDHLDITRTNWSEAIDEEPGHWGGYHITLGDGVNWEGAGGEQGGLHIWGWNGDWAEAYDSAIMLNARRLRFFGTAGENPEDTDCVEQPEATGDRRGVAALTSALTGLAALGLIKDSTTDSGVPASHSHLPADILASGSDVLIGRISGVGGCEEIPCTAFARSVLDDANAAAARTTLGLTIGGPGSPGDVQAWDMDLQAIANMTSGAGWVYRAGEGYWSIEPTLNSADIQAGAGPSVIGKADAGAGNCEDIVSTEDLQTLIRRDGELTWAQLKIEELDDYYPATDSLRFTDQHLEFRTSSAGGFLRCDAGSGLAFLVAGTMDSPTWARIKQTTMGTIQFQDRGVSVFDWICSATAADRRMRSYVPFTRHAFACYHAGSHVASITPDGFNYELQSYFVNTGDTVINIPTNFMDGMTMQLMINNNSPTPHTLTLNGSYKSAAKTYQMGAYKWMIVSITRCDYYYFAAVIANAS